MRLDRRSGERPAAIDLDRVAVDRRPVRPAPRARPRSRRPGPIPCGAAPRCPGSRFARLATAAARQRAGISSIAAATSAAVTSIPRSVLLRTTRSASGSPRSSSPAAPTGRTSISAPIRRSRSMIARRVGFVPTFRRVSSASGWIAAATSQNAAPEMSPGTRWSSGADAGRAVDCVDGAAVGEVLRPHGDAAGAEHPLGVVAGGHGLADRRRALRGKPGQEDRRLHLGGGHRRSRDRWARGAPGP